MTPTLKIKRFAIRQAYGAALQALYDANRKAEPRSDGKLPLSRSRPSLWDEIPRPKERGFRRPRELLTVSSHSCVMRAILRANGRPAGMRNAITIWCAGDHLEVVLRGDLQFEHLDNTLIRICYWVFAPWRAA